MIIDHHLSINIGHRLPIETQCLLRNQILEMQDNLLHISLGHHLHINIGHRLPITIGHRLPIETQ